MSEKRLVPLYAEPHHVVPRKYLVDRADFCINCGTCISACIYGCHERSKAEIRKMGDPKADCCRNCFACILRCPRGALNMRINPAYEAMGHKEVFTPAAILAIADQAEQGKVPVSGSGFGGPFDGDGYDNIWTDMSEIVRPTRDGIHGREHISTTVNLGRKIKDICGLEFDSSGSLKSQIPPSREIPFPILFGDSPYPLQPEARTAIALAASQLHTFTAITAEEFSEITAHEPETGVPDLMDFFNHFIIRIHPNQIDRYHEILAWASMVEIEAGIGQIEASRRARAINPQLITVLRVPAGFEVETEIGNLVRQGAEIIHLSGDMYGRGDQGVPLLYTLEKVHRSLIDSGLRDEVTLLVSGGIAAAEHIPKTIILGADAVFVDVPLLVALECLVCGDCADGKPCPNSVGVPDRTWDEKYSEGKLLYKWGGMRIINLMLAWRDQLLEVLGAMGIRDVRRLRGETGRAIFADKMKTSFLDRLNTKDNKAGGDWEKSSSFRYDFANRDLLADDSGSARRRFAVLPGDWFVNVNRDKCVDCEICAVSCRFGVHARIEGRTALAEPVHGKCIGPECERENDWCCVKVCPWDAIAIERSTLDDVLGDKRWTSALLKETYRLARTGQPADTGGELLGASGGGFDVLRIKAYAAIPKVREEDVTLEIPLNKRRDFKNEETISIPVYGGGMSYGSISLEVMIGRAMAAEKFNTFTSTGEGGYPDELLPFKDNVITQIATGLFGVREETIQRSKMVEFKYAQGAKPGLGGHLLGEKNTPDVAMMREAVEGTSLFSPFPFHSVYSVEDHKKHLDWIRSIHPEVLLSVKVSTPGDVDMVAVGSFYAGANIVNLDGSYGGTGAAPDIAKKNIAMPIEYAVTQVHDFLVAEGIRDQVVLITGGGIRTADDILKAIALGADGVVVGTADLVAIDCVRCGNCERDRGCPIGIATTDNDLSSQLSAEWICTRITNMYSAWSIHMRKKLAALNMKSVRELSGDRSALAYVGLK